VQAEPFFASLVVYDLKENDRVSEAFTFDLNRPFEAPPVNQQQPPDIATKCREAIFNVLSAHPEVYLVLTVEKVLQGDISSVLDLYSKGADKQKAAQKQRDTATAARARLGHHRMPFAWAARPLFKTNSALDMDSQFSPFFKQDANKLKDEDILKMVSDYHAYLVQQATGGGKKAKINLSVVPGHFKASVVPFAQRQHEVENILTHSLIPLKTNRAGGRPQSQASLPAREVLSFPLQFETMPAPHAEYADYIYIYPQSLDFSIKKAASASKTSARNIAWNVQLVHSDGGPMMQPPSTMQPPASLPNIFGKSSGPMFCPSAAAPVSYHNKTPLFYEEVKIKLPAKLDENHHVLFTFYHIEVNADSKKNKGQVQAPIGYAWIPLCKPRTRILDHEVFSEHRLLVASANVKYTGSAVLPGQYFQARNNSNGQQTAGPNIKWLDSGKPLAHVKVKQFSTVRSADDYIVKFFQIDAKQQPKFLLDCIEGLRRANLSAVFAHLPVVLNKLFSLLVEPKDERVDSDVSRTIVSVILHIVAQYCEKTSSGEANSSSFLTSYAYYVFDHGALPRGGKTVHDKLVKCLASLMTTDSRAEAPGKEARAADQEKFLRHSWFFYQIIFKSMAQNAIARSAAARKGRFSDELVQNMRNLIVNIAHTLMKRISEDITMCFKTNDNLAYFLQSCFGIMDRGVVFSIIQQYLHNIQANNLNFRIFRLNFVRIICEYEHFVPLSLPFVSGSEICVEPLDKNPDFEKRHVLPGILLRALQETLVADYTENALDMVELRQKCIATICGLFRKHDGDKRYCDSKEKLACITTMYFPLLNIVMQNYLRMFGVILTRKQAQKDAQKDLFGENETRELLFCFVWILRYAHKDHLRQWWKSDFCRLERFLDVLNLCLSTFEYQGSKKLHHSAASSSTTAEASKRGLEQLYGGNVASTLTTGRRSSTGSSVAGLRRKRSNSIPVEPAGGRAHLEVGGSPSSAKDAMRRSNYSKYNSGISMGTMDVGQRVTMQSHLSTEVSMVVLRVVDQMFVDHKTEIEFDGGANKITYKLFKLLTDMYSLGLSVRAVSVWMNTMHAFLHSFSYVLFQVSAEYCQSLCSLLLRACNSLLPALRDHACTLLYAMLRANQPRVSLDVTVALSRLDVKDDAHLRASLASIGEFCQTDAHGQDTQFPREVSQLMDQLRQVLIAMAEMHQYDNDPDMLADLQLQVANSYKKTPKLRLVWLEKLAQLHDDHGNASEAAMCVCQCAALITEYLKSKNNPMVMSGSEVFSSISPTRGLVKLDSFESYDGEGDVDVDMVASMPDADLATSSPLFSEKGLLEMLPHAVKYFKEGRRFELVGQVYKLMIPFYERDRDYEDLAEACEDMRICYQEVVKANEQEKSGHNRQLGLYYRVGFFGSLFGHLNGHEYIYKEAAMERIAAFVARLRDTHVARFGASKVTIIQDAALPAPLETLKACGTAHIQVISVEPHYAKYKAMGRVGSFELNHLVDEFLLETPFTKSGKARGDVKAQCMRHLIMKVETGTSFPYVKKRLRIVQQETHEMEPIDVALDAMTKKCDSLERVVSAKSKEGDKEGAHPDMKGLQLQLQGIVSIQVNSGPMEYASVFLSTQTRDQFAAKKVKELQEQFARMLSLVDMGLKRNNLTIQVIFPSCWNPLFASACSPVRALKVRGRGVGIFPDVFTCACVGAGRPT